MTAPCLPLIAVLSCALGGRAAAVDDVCPELQGLVPDLVSVDRMRGATNRHVVSDARVAELERRLGEYLGLPPELRVRLTTVSGHRREVAKRGLVTMSLVHPLSGMDLGLWIATWDGECVYSEGVRFQRGEAPDEQGCSRHRGTHYPRALLPRMFERASEVVDVAVAARHPISVVQLRSGSFTATPPFATARVYMRVEHPPGEASVSVTVRLPLAEGPEETEGPPSARGPRADASSLGLLLETGLALVERIDLAFPHSIQVYPEPADPAVFALVLDPYDHAHPVVPIRARLRRGAGADGEWTVADGTGALPFGAVRLDTFVALVNRVARIAIGTDRTIGAFGLARGETGGDAIACLVTVDAETIWAAERGVLHLLRAGAGRAAEVALEVELPALEFPLDSRAGRVGRTSRDGAFHIEIQDGEILVRHPQPPILRFRDREFALMGGRGLE